MWLVGVGGILGVVSRRWVWVESMGVASGCVYKELYTFPHITYPYSSCICSFLQQHPYFLFIFFLWANNRILYTRKYWRSNNLEILLKIELLKISAEFEFGGESTSHASVLRLLLCLKCLRIFILAIPISTAKSPNLISRQIYLLYGMI